MDMKKRMGAVAVLAVVMFGTEAGAAPAAPGGTQSKAESPAPEATFILKTGEGKDLPANDVVRVAIGDPEIADIAIRNEGGTVIHMTGSKAGETTLRVWTKDGGSRTYQVITRD